MQLIGVLYMMGEGVMSASISVLHTQGRCEEYGGGGSAGKETIRVCGGWGGEERVGGTSETLYHRDDTLLYIAYIMLIWAASIPADRWHCSLWP